MVLGPTTKGGDVAIINGDLGRLCVFVLGCSVICLFVLFLLLVFGVWVFSKI